MSAKKIGTLVGGALLGAGTLITAGAVILIQKTIPRPKGVDEDLIQKFSDPERSKAFHAGTDEIKNWLANQKTEDVYVTSHDGLRLHGLYLPAADPGKKLVIFHHGFASTALDCCAQARFFHTLGYDVLLIDLRAHAQSEGNHVGFGILEHRDTLSWVEYAKKRFGEKVKIVLHGTSMGAGTVLMSLGLEEIQKTVSAVIADCGFTSPAALFSFMIRHQYHLPFPAPIIRLASVFSKAWAGYSFYDLSTTDALKNNQVPLLLIHGTADQFVPVAMSEENFRASPSMKKLLLVEHAGHGFSYFENTELYQRTVREFLDEALSDPQP